MNIAEMNIRTEAERVEAIKAVAEQYKDGLVTEPERDALLAELKALDLNAKPSNSGTNPLLKAMGIIGNDKPQGYRDAKDLNQQADHNISVVAIEYSAWNDTTKQATRKYLTGDVDVDKKIKEECLDNGIVYMRLSNGANVSLSKHTLPQDERGVNVVPNVGDTVSVVTIKLGDVIDTSQKANLGVSSPNAPYGIFEHTDKNKYAICRVQTGVERLLKVKRALTYEQKMEAFGKMKMKEVTAEQALAQLGL